MNPFARLLCCSLLLFTAACTCSPTRAAIGEEPAVLVNVDKEGRALAGHDAVAFFTEMKPVAGNPKFASHYMGAHYLFASPEHKAAFDQEPEKYAPAFGGYCGYAASIDRLSPVDVRFFEVLDGRLVLQHNQRAWDKWHADLQGNLTLADKNWPGLVERNAQSPKRLVNADTNGLALEGYDAVAYFTEKMPVKGKALHAAMYDGATYQFVSEAHRELFERDPAHYVPKYGGFCGYAASINKVSPVNPQLFQIVDERLILQHTPKAYQLFNKNVDGNVVRADKNWPGLVACKGK